MQARQTIGLTGLDPVSKYDFEGTGTGDRINSVLIAKLHNPGCTDFSIKMMSPQALEGARGCLDKESGHPTKDFDNIQDIRIALATLRITTRRIFPWDWEVETLDFFMTTVQFGEREFGFKPPQPKLNFICDFIDQILHHNLQNWHDFGLDKFMDFPAIRTKWLGDLSDKFPRTGLYQRFEPRGKQSKEGGGGGGGQGPTSKPQGSEDTGGPPTASVTGVDM